MKLKDMGKIFIGLFLPPIDDVVGYFSHKKQANAMPWLFRLKRIFSIVTFVALIGILIAGFIGALAVPFPGVAPLYAVGVAGIAKAFGITLGYSLIFAKAGQAVGAFLGTIIDKIRLHMMLKEKDQINPKINPFTISISIGLIGENGYIPEKKQQQKKQKPKKQQQQHISTLLPRLNSNDPEKNIEEEKKSTIVKTWDHISKDDAYNIDKNESQINKSVTRGHAKR